jgi:hypothetical protein
MVIVVVTNSISTIVFDMEDDLQDARNLIRALLRLTAEDDEDLEPLHTVAKKASDAVESLSESWDKLFQLTRGQG